MLFAIFLFVLCGSSGIVRIYPLVSTWLALSEPIVTTTARITYSTEGVADIPSIIPHHRITGGQERPSDEEHCRIAEVELRSSHLYWVWILIQIMIMKNNRKL